MLKLTQLAAELTMGYIKSIAEQIVWCHLIRIIHAVKTYIHSNNQIVLAHNLVTVVV